MDSGTTEDIESVWGSGPGDVYAVGSTILHYDGTTWSPMVSGTSNWLHDVWGSSATDVLAVGEYGTILHQDGTPHPCSCCDLTGDNRVDFQDIGPFSGAYGSSSGDLRYNPRADFNHDGMVDGDDLLLFEACDSGPDVPPAPGCEDRDLDNDGDVDQADFGEVQRSYD